MLHTLGMNVYLCTTQPDIFRFLANRIEKLGHSCVIFSDYTNLKNTLVRSQYLPDLVLVDYMVENHILTSNPYEKLDETKTYLPLIYYNDPCIAKGARVSVWKDIIQNFCNKEYIPEGKFVPDDNIIEEVLKTVSDFVESEQFSPYIHLMTPPPPFPEVFSTDFLYEKITYNKNHYKSIKDFKIKTKLPDNLFILLQIFYDRKNENISLQELKEYYQERKGSITEDSLKVQISKIKSYIKKNPEYNYKIEHSPKGYLFLIED